MESIIDFIFANAPHAHWIIFSSLLLAGMNIPISEDLMIIISAILASTVIPENALILFIFLFMGCYFSDSIAYWIGRSLGRKLWNFKWFAKLISKKRLNQAQKYYENHGFLTLLIGRFIPFGIRNTLFITAGMGKMSYGKFLMSDGIACFCSNATLFLLTYMVGKNYRVLLDHLKIVKIVVFILFIAVCIFLIWYYKKRRQSGKISP